MNKCSGTAIKHYLQNHVLGHSAPTLTYTKDCGLLEMVSTLVNIKHFFSRFFNSKLQAIPLCSNL